MHHYQIANTPSAILDQVGASSNRSFRVQAHSENTVVVVIIIIIIIIIYLFIYLLKQWLVKK